MNFEPNKFSEGFFGYKYVIFILKGDNKTIKCSLTTNWKILFKKKSALVFIKWTCSPSHILWISFWFHVIVVSFFLISSYYSKIQPSEGLLHCQDSSPWCTSRCKFSNSSSNHLRLSIITHFIVNQTFLFNFKIL